MQIADRSNLHLPIPNVFLMEFLLKTKRPLGKTQASPFLGLPNFSIVGFSCCVGLYLHVPIDHLLYDGAGDLWALFMTEGDMLK